MTKPASFAARYPAQIDMAVIGVIWLLSLLIVNPVGDFPLNDDWAYGLTVKKFIETWDYQPVGWAGMPLLVNVLWGSLFCIPFGFSYTVLRFSNLVAACLGMFGVYGLVRNLSRSRYLAITCALLLAFNPVHYSLSNTVMTDVLFTSLVVVAALYLTRYLQAGQFASLAIGTAFIVIATLSRNLALSLAMGFCVAQLARFGITKKSLAISLTPLILCLVVLLAYQQWLASTGRMPAEYNAKITELLAILRVPSHLFGNLKQNSYVAALYLGLFLFPMMVIIYVDIAAENIKKSLIMLAIALVAACLPIAFRDEFPLMPLSQNILSQWGLGPLLLRDTHVYHMGHFPVLPKVFWVVTTLFSLAGAGIIIVVAVSGISKLAQALKGRTVGREQAAGIFFVVAAIAQFVPLIVHGFFDRYLVPPIFFLGFGLLCFHSHLSYKRPLLTAIPVSGFIIAMSIFAVLGTRDYLAWNRTRWVALSDLVHKQHIPPDEIDGGFEFNGTYFYDPKYQRKQGKSWWWVQGNEYVLAFGPLSGYGVFKSYTYEHWMPPGTGNILVLRKMPQGQR